MSAPHSLRPRYFTLPELSARVSHSFLDAEEIATDSTNSFIVATISSTGVLPLNRWLGMALVRIFLRTYSIVYSCCVPVQKINVVGPKPTQALGNCHTNIFTIIPDLAASVGRDMVSELCSQKYLLTISEGVLFLENGACWPHLFPLPCSLKPPSKQFFAITIKRRRVPMRTSELVDAIKQLESFFIGGGNSVKCFVKCQLSRHLGEAQYVGSSTA